MTCIVGFTHRNKVYIGGDSAGVGGYDIRLRKDPKVFIVGDFIIGYTSSFRMGQLLRYNLKPSKQRKGKEDFEYMCTTFVDAVRKCLKSGGYSKVDNNVESGGHFLVGYKGKLYHIQGDFQVSEGLESYVSVGCGDNYAIGALRVLENSKIKTEQKVKTALETAEHFSTGVRGPFIILSL